jgi:methylmalonyl-CoA mutase cobalamin-binding subunit
MIRQHIAAAERHIARQRVIIAEMTRDGHPRAADLGARLLQTMLFYLDNAIAHRDRLEGRERLRRHRL